MRWVGGRPGECIGRLTEARCAGRSASQASTHRSCKCASRASHGPRHPLALGATDTPSIVRVGGARGGLAWWSQRAVGLAWRSARRKVLPAMHWRAGPGGSAQRSRAAPGTEPDLRVQVLVVWHLRAAICEGPGRRWGAGADVPPLFAVCAPARACARAAPAGLRSPPGQLPSPHSLMQQLCACSNAPSGGSRHCVKGGAAGGALLHRWALVLAR